MQLIRKTSTLAITNIALIGLFALFWLGANAGCSSKTIEKKVHYDVARVDTIHGMAYPYEFTRARDLLDNQFYEAAAYDYIILYPTSPDSAVHEAMKMQAVLEADHAPHNVVWYLKQCLATEAMQDPEYAKDGAVIDLIRKRRYTAADELLYALQQYGIK